MTLSLLIWAWRTETEGGLWPPPAFIRPGKTTCCWVKCICINTQHEHTWKDSVTYTYIRMVLNMQMDPSKGAHAPWVVHTAQCQHDILRMSVFSPCMSSPVVFFLLYCRLFHLSFVLHWLSCFFSFTLLPGDICCPKTICLPPFRGHSLCPLPSSKGIFRLPFACLTECLLAFSTLVFICHLLLLLSHYSLRLLLNGYVVRNKIWEQIVCPKKPWVLEANKQS